MESQVTFRGVLLGGAFALSALLAASAPARLGSPHCHNHGRKSEHRARHRPLVKRSRLENRRRVREILQFHDASAGCSGDNGIFALRLQKSVLRRALRASGNPHCRHPDRRPCRSCYRRSRGAEPGNVRKRWTRLPISGERAWNPRRILKRKRPLCSGWKSVTRIFPNGDWNAVYVIPLNVIRAQGGSKQNWQVNVVRFLSSANDSYTWAYDDTMSSVGSAQYWPHLAGIEISAAAARPRPHADVYGLGSAGADRGVFQNGIGNFEQMKPRPYGVDVTYPVTNTLALVGTLNPDFSNVEQDQTTIAPQEFQRQYNEYRPFFAQGANYINTLPGTNINSADIPFYSPRIGVFNSGVKLEGHARAELDRNSERHRGRL